MAPLPLVGASAVHGTIPVFDLMEEPVSAVAERPVVAVKPDGAVFLSRRSDLRLIIKPERQRRNAEGEVVDTVPGERVAFVDGKLRVPADGEMRGEHGEQLDAAVVRRFLMGHSHFGDKFDGFWLHEEPAPAVSAEEHDALAAMAMELDAAAIERLIGQEEAGWGRQDFLSGARAQLERVRAKAQEIEARVEAARAEGAAAAGDSRKPQAKEAR